jgi:hypothetical protein
VLITYLEKMLQLPLPSTEQNERFAEYVTEAHSWYKHLPFFPPGAGFVFYLDHHAGTKVERGPAGYVVRELHDQRDCWHYSEMITAEYRERFGYWSYWVDDNPRTAGDRAEGPLIFNAETDECELLPPEIKARWTCRLTAFLRPAPPMFVLRSRELRAERESFEKVLRTRPNDLPVSHYRQLLDALGPTPERGSVISPDGWLLIENEMNFQRERLLATISRIASEISALSRC